MDVTSGLLRDIIWQIINDDLHDNRDTSEIVEVVMGKLVPLIIDIAAIQLEELHARSSEPDASTFNFAIERARLLLVDLKDEISSGRFIVKF